MFGLALLVRAHAGDQAQREIVMSSSTSSMVLKETSVTNKVQSVNPFRWLEYLEHIQKVWMFMFRQDRHQEIEDLPVILIIAMIYMERYFVVLDEQRQRYDRGELDVLELYPPFQSETLLPC